MHGISPLLFARCAQRGPPAWQRFLAEQHRQCAARQRLIERLLLDLDEAARADGLGFVALKGAALHAAGLYAAGERPMGDVDLLIREADSERLARALESLGYAAGHAYRRHRVFEPTGRRPPPKILPGEHVDNPIKVEVHTRIAEKLPCAEVEVTRSLLPGELRPGRNAYASRASLMLHLLLHAAGNMRARALRLIQLHDIALLAAALEASDWDALAGASGDLWWAAAPLALVARYYPSSVPEAVLKSALAHSPRLLQRAIRRHRLTEVSWSNIYVQALPGLEYSRSLGDALGLIASRLWPSATARAELTQGSAQIIGGESVPWYGLSHRRRILRFVVSRPPRVQTLLCIRAALLGGR